MADALATYSRAELIGQLNVEKSQLREIRLLGKTDDNELKNIPPIIPLQKSVLETHFLGTELQSP